MNQIIEAHKNFIIEIPLAKFQLIEKFCLTLTFNHMQLYLECVRASSNKIHEILSI